jgi:hypothetical protein
VGSMPANGIRSCTIREPLITIVFVGKEPVTSKPSKNFPHVPVVLDVTRASAA